MPKDEIKIRMQEVNSPKVQIKLVMKTEDVAVLSLLASKEGISLKAYIKKLIENLCAKSQSEK